MGGGVAVRAGFLLGAFCVCDGRCVCGLLQLQWNLCFGQLKRGKESKLSLAFGHQSSSFSLPVSRSPGSREAAVIVSGAHWGSPRQRGAELTVICKLESKIQISCLDS